ncbi:MAG: hypothetical protein M5U26_10875 [Planctomycetota bacterium]|nr:hypothetical protein [Planctomycetota bacterium]
MTRILKRLGLLALALALAAPSAFAQGCPMCRENAAALPAEGQQAMNLGILLLVVPPLLFLGACIVTLVRYARADAGSQGPSLPRVTVTSPVRQP